MYTYNVAAILAELVEIRKGQVINFGKQPGGQFDAAMTNLIGTVARLAMNDRTPKARIITANTGSSKTSGAACLAVAGYREDPNFSCTYICENIRGVEDFLNKVRSLLTDQEQWYGIEGSKRDIIATRRHITPAPMASAVGRPKSSSRGSRRSSRRRRRSSRTKRS
jgi:hypothetical protein